MAIVGQNIWLKSVKVKTLSGEILEFTDGVDNVFLHKDDDKNNVVITFRNKDDYNLNKTIEFLNLPMEKIFYTPEELKRRRDNQ